MISLKHLRNLIVNRRDKIGNALKDKNVFTRKEAIQDPNATPEHISRALKDKNPYIRQAAIEHPNATSEHISTALKDKNSAVRQAAARKRAQF